MSWLDEFWADLLSEDPLRITAAWVTLQPDEQGYIHDHLQNMANEEGWLDSQREAARFALTVIDESDAQ